MPSRAAYSSATAGVREIAASSWLTVLLTGRPTVLLTGRPISWLGDWR